MSVVPTGGQTVGPFFGYALPFPDGEALVPPGHPGAVVLTGRVLDGGGDPVPDALVEIWQTDEEGRVVQQPGSLHRAAEAFTGWGRCPTDAAGRYRFTTVRPGGANSFFAMTVFARGLAHRLFTRAYLAGAADELLGSLPADRRATLMTTEESGVLTFDVHLQGLDETVFLRFPGHEQ